MEEGIASRKKGERGMGEEDQMAADDCPPLHRNPGATIS